MNLLFICSRNKWRSPSAEYLYKNHPTIHAKSAGTEPSARIKVNAKHIDWADIIFVMEKKHKQRLLEKFPENSIAKSIIILDIADEYQYLDPELLEMIERAVAPYLED